MKIRKRLRQTIAAIMASVMLFGECVTGYAAKSEEESSLPYDIVMTEDMKKDFLQTPAVTPEEQAEVLFELDELREQSGKQFRLSDGTILAAQYGMDVHYEDENGNFKEIDNRFLYEAAETAEDFAGYSTAEGAVEYKFAPQIQDGEILKVSDGEYSVGFSMLAPQVEEEAEPTPEVTPEPTVEQTPVVTENPEVSTIPLLTPEELQPIVPTVEILPQPTAEATVMGKPENETQEQMDTEVLVPGTEVSEKKLSEASLMFLKGEVLNATELPNEMQLVETEAGTLKVWLTEEEQADSKIDIADAADRLSGNQMNDKVETAETVWVNIEGEKPEVEEADLLEAIKVEKAISSVGYEAVLPGVSLQYVMQGSSLKEYIILEKKQECYEFEFELVLDNLTPELMADGRILLKDSVNDMVVYEIPAGYMTDASNVRSEAVTMNIRQKEDHSGRWILTVAADEEWINAKERTFPVVIDPTLNHQLSSLTDTRGSFVAQAYPTQSFVDSEAILIGYDHTAAQANQLRAYIQLRNLPTLPKDSVICKAVCHFGVVDFEQSGYPALNVRIKELLSNTTTWNDQFTWNTKPEISSTVMDYRSITSSSVNKYLGWDITELVKEHYLESTGSNYVSAFAMEAYGGTSMNDSKYGMVTLCLNHTSAYPVIQVTYRDTKGVENYYTYQTHYHGNAGTAYLGDYTGQLTLVRPVVSYESTILSCGLSLVYNSAYGDKYFTNDGTNIHTKNFTTMKLGLGWKLSAQETVTTVSLQDVVGNESTQTTWLIYNDSDGTEHYFKETESGSGIFEDEDGLNLTITKTGTDFTMKDKMDNIKFFKNGYLTRITDANQNKIHIVYGNGTVANNVPSNTGANRITSVWVQPRNKAAEKIFTLNYDSSNRLVQIGETYGTTHRFTYETVGNSYILKSIQSYSPSRKTSTFDGYVTMAKYGYDSGHKSLAYVVDPETGRNVFYQYKKSMTGHRIDYYREYVGNEFGNEIVVNTDELRKTVYTDSGADRDFGTPDDIITTILFNSWGQTVNVYTEDFHGNLLGATAAAYENEGGTSATNHRMLSSVSSGQAGVNLLKNGSFESYTGTTATGWSSTSWDGTAACRTTAPHRGNAHYNLHNNSLTGGQTIYQDITLTAGVAYTASAYVNTAGMESVASDGGAFMRILNASGNEVASGTRITYCTDSGIDNGWQRISVTYQPSVTATYRVQVVWKNAVGTLRADDVQLEAASAPSSFNLLTNGSFEYGEESWRLTDEDLEHIESGISLHGNKSFRANGYQNTILYAEQEVKIQRSSDTTFLLSGWCKGDSLPDIEESGIDENGKFWGLMITLKYADNITEVHEVPFNEYVHDWQYTAMAVVPKRAGKTISTAIVRLCYYNNANAAWFDNISLTEEPAQTYIYDNKGNVETVKSAENGEDDYDYDATTQNLLEVATEGSGTYKYEYQNAVNPHLPTKVTNDTVSLKIDYDDHGQATKTTLSGTGETYHMESSATYENGLLTSQTDNTGSTVSYGYNSYREACTATNAKDITIETHRDDVYGRMQQSFQSGKVSVNAGYTNGYLSTLDRGGYITQGGAKQTQTYRFGNDAFGKNTSVRVGNNTLAEYSYEERNGVLNAMYYGAKSDPLATVSYTYDKLDRISTVTYHDDASNTSTVYEHDYSADGNLAGVTINGELCYTYDYDSLGRLIYSAKLENGRPELYTSHQYDTSNRIVRQNWQIGSKGFYELYNYSQNDGTLTDMTVFDGNSAQNIQFYYDGMKRLHTQEFPEHWIRYNYRVTDSTKKTVSNQIQSMNYYDRSSSWRFLDLEYAYDVLGNITSVKKNSAIAAQYTYDTQNQLLTETLSDQSSVYTYDTYGNLRTKTTAFDDGKTEQYTYTYGNSDWLDQLTGVSYKNKSGQTVIKALDYDAVGNPLHFYDGASMWTFTWKNGRQLSSAYNGVYTFQNPLTFTYDAGGIRTGKTVNGVVHDYVMLGDQLVRETYGTTTVDYFYEKGGKPYKVIVDDNGTVYTGYFVLNLQGDIVAILDSDSDVVVEYEYDAWGQEISHTAVEGVGAKLYEHNALKYRGYYYDVHLGMYYLMSRYYSPRLGRFVNADVQLNMDCGFLGMNLYAYCLNNPISYKDSNGQRPVAGTTIDGETSDEREQSIKHAKENAPKKGTSLPTKGEPGGSDVFLNPDGSIKQKRWYGPDGNAVRDRDYNHPGDMEFPHDHTWNNGTRDKDHLPVSPDYEFEMNKLTNGVIVFACGAGIFMIAANDITGAGVLDDPLIIPLFTTLKEGIIEIFK